MATYNPLAEVNISLATATFERVGFGIPLFITSSRSFPERTRSYRSLEDVGSDFSTSSNAYRAAQSAFSSSNGLNTLIIGRREADAVLSLVAAPQQNENFQLKVEVNDGDEVTVNYTESGASPTQESVLTAIKGLIDADGDVASHVTTTVSGTGASATLTISPIAATDFFILSGVSNLNEAYTGTETGAEVYQAIVQENDSFYAVTADDKSEAFVLSLAASVNADDKQYWVSTAEQGSLELLAEPATDLLGKLRENNYARVVGIYHQEAETTFPELAELGHNLPFLAGSIVWGNDITSGVPASRNSAGILLTTTQKNNLLARNAAFWDRQGGVDFFNSDVFTMNGERPENIRGRDSMRADMITELRGLLLSQNGTKIPYNNSGIAQIENTVRQVLDTYVQRNFIQGNYVITTPDARNISVQKKASQLFDELTFVAQLTGAITMVEVMGTLQLEEVVQ